MFDVNTFNVNEYDRILSKGLSSGLGERGHQVCIEAAICQVLGLPHGDDPGCVGKSLRRLKIYLNDCSLWSSPEARAKGLRDLGLAQLGSLGVVSDSEFCKRLSEKLIRVLIPTLLRDLFPHNTKLLSAADRCEREGTAASADYAAAEAASSAEAARSARAAAWAAEARAARAAAWAARAAVAAAWAARAAADRYLSLVANLALETLRELNSPGCALLEQKG